MINMDSNALMKRWIPLLLIVLITMLSIFSVSYAQDATAEAINYANLRSAPNVDAEQVGQIDSGSRYPIVGQSALYPWLLIGDPTTQQPIGWVYETLVTVTGNINNVPITELAVTTGQLIASPTVIPPTPVPGQITATPAAVQSQPTATATVFQATTGVTGSVRGEVNIRYGPDVTYDRVGVAQAGDTFELLAYHTQVPWVKIRYENSPNGEAWIAESLLDITGDVFSLDRESSTNLLLPTLTPTPSVISASSLRGDDTPLSPEFAALGNRLWQRVLDAGFDPETSRFGALFLLDLQTGEALTFGENIAFSGTSINKISILTRLYAELEIPPTVTLATDIANTMICSENAATNRLLATIGGGDEFADDLASLAE
ncbi:MAG: SH3 domain-containing protein [Aggregatilineales bacterium]